MLVNAPQKQVWDVHVHIEEDCFEPEGSPYVATNFFVIRLDTKTLTNGQHHLELLAGKRPDSIEAVQMLTRNGQVLEYKEMPFKPWTIKIVNP